MFLIPLAIAVWAGWIELTVWWVIAAVVAEPLFWMLTIGVFGED
jgi:hypothetical protein